MPEPLNPDDPSIMGHYRLLSRLGRGGMGTVYLAEGPEGRRVAVKVINLELANSPQFLERFRREVEAARRVRRFCTAPVLDFALETPPWYIVTEFVDGPSLQETVEQRGPLHGSDLEGLAVGVATALSAIHDAGLVHRDLKPANVLLSPVGPRVIDFGIARALDAPSGVTGTGQIIGTPAYLAPELVTGGQLSAAADVFSWGCVVAFAGTGRSPFSGRTLPETLHRVAYDVPVLDGLDEELKGVVERSLAKNPAVRPTVPELLEQLTGRRTPPTFLPTMPPPGPVPQTEQASRPHRGKPFGLIIAAAAVVIGLAVSAYLLSQRDDSDPTGGKPTTQPTSADWTTTAKALRGRNGQKFTFACGSNGAAGSVWGTDLYTDDSSICTAAVHSGLITLSKGGTVTIEIAPGDTSYTGSSRGGITSSDYGSWTGSFKFVS